MIFIHLLVLLVFVNRYLLGTFLKRARDVTFDETDHSYRPTVTIVIPMFNEGPGIYDTVMSLLEQDYPAELMSIIVVDDRSTDDSYAWAMKAAQTNPRVRVIQNAVNMGKRRSINHAVREADAEVIVSVDSDVVVDPGAVRQLVARFTRPEIAAVGGRVCVSNAHDNWLTKMQGIKYYFGYEFLKNVERAYQSVLCLSGCLTAYRRHVLVELEPILENRNLLGIPIKYGEDRFLTRQIVKAGWRTVLTLDAISYTVAPRTLSNYFAQQLRWRRSNIVDYLGGLSHVWKLHPVVAVHYYSLFALLLAYPVVVFHTLLTHRFWPLALLHAAVLALLGAFYRMSVSHLPAEQRIHPLWFMAMTVVMPVTYLLYTPLALFTLDSGSWETRGHGQVAVTLDTLTPAADAAPSAPLAVTVGAAFESLEGRAELEVAAR